MNTKIISKCLDELKNESPDLSYIRGMLETLLETEFSSVQNQISIPNHQDQSNIPYRVPMMPYSMIPSGNLPITNLPVTSSSTAISPESAAVDAALAMIGGIQPKLGVVTLEKNVLLNG